MALRLKCLKLESWMQHKTSREDCIRYGNEYHAIDPILNRDGYYCYGAVSWFEVNDQAWMCSTTHAFASALDTLNAAELRPEQIRGLKAIAKSNLATKQQRKLLFDYHQYRLTSRVRRSALRTVLRFKKNVLSQ